MQKGLKGAGSFYWLKESGGGYGQKRPFFLLLASRTGEGGGERRRRPIRPPWTSTAARGRGKRGWGPCGVDSRPHLGPGRRSGAGRRGPAAAALLKRGGGASAEEGRRGVAARFEAVGVVLGEGSTASFIGGGGVLAGGKLAGGLMAVGAGVNGGRARRGDVTPQAGGDLLQAPLCRGRRRLCGVNGGRWRGVSAQGWLGRARVQRQGERGGQ